MADRPQRGGWRPGEIFRAALIAAGVVVALLFLWKTRSVAIVGLLGILVGIVLSAAAERASRLGVPRGVAAPLILVLFLAALTGVGFLLAPTLRMQTEEVRSRLPEVLDRIEGELGISGERIAADVLRQTAESAPEQPDRASEEEQGASETPRGGGEAGAEEDGRLRRAVGENLRHLGQMLFPVATAMVDAVTAIVIILFFGLFIAIEPDSYVKGIVGLFPAEKRKRAREVLSELGSSLRQWLVARLIAMLAVGIIVAVTMAALGVRSAILLGVIAGLLEFVPFFGPIVAAIPAVGMALLDSPQKALWVVIAFVVIQLIEGNLLTPVLLEKRVHIPPALTILSIPALMLVFGLPGALIAEPVVAIALVLAREARPD
ncbi:MAG TPA: AI-2E family transporter [Thermoanaerobaculia bacterium]|nr:AI-2E family transporter [Thermoanaerobaculia bacterium]